MNDAAADLKRRAAEQAAGLVENQMVVGLGTGSTAAFAIAALGRRVREGLRLVAVATSERSAAQAREEGIALSDLDHHPVVDITIDGADEITRVGLDLIKGLGGALLREKIVARASKRLVIIADHSKLVAHLGERAPIPVETVPFAQSLVARHLAALGARTQLRRDAAGAVFITDSGNIVLDAHMGVLEEPQATEQAIKQITGVVDCGLFLGLATEALVATPDGVRVLNR